MVGIIWAIVLSMLLLLSFALSNVLHSRGMPFYGSRKVAHFGAGFATLPFPFVFEGTFYPSLLSGSFLLLMVFTHRSEIFHGFVRKGRLSELHFGLAAFLCFLLLWSLDPWLATVPVLFVAFGDGITGVIRAQVYKREVKGVWGSVGMLVVCLLISVPTLGLAGVVGSVAGTLAEKQPWVDDNLAIPVVAVAVMFPVWLLL